MALFEVQTVDPKSGVESWTPVSAHTAEEAKSRVSDTGMVIGAVRLKAMDDPSPPPFYAPREVAAMNKREMVEAQVEAARILRQQESRRQWRLIFGGLGLAILALLAVAMPRCGEDPVEARRRATAPKDPPRVEGYNEAQLRKEGKIE
jgi:hypothetical protein